jgi:hypothetical protein
VALLLLLLLVLLVLLLVLLVLLLGATGGSASLACANSNAAQLRAGKVGSKLFTAISSLHAPSTR